MLLVSFGLAILPYWRRLDGRHRDAEGAIEHFKDRLADIDRDREEGLIDEAAAVEAKRELERSLLVFAASNVDAPDSRTTLPARLVQATIALLLMGGIGLYLTLGRPALDGAASSGLPSAVAPDPEFDARADELQARLEGGLDDPRGWMVLARALAGRGRIAEAAAAMEEAYRLEPDNPEILANFGEVIVAHSKGRVTAAATLIFDRLRAAAPDHPGPDYYRGIARAQAGDEAAAREIWQALLERMAPDNPWRSRVAGQLGLENDRPAGPPISDEDRAAVAQMSPQEQQQFIESMVQRLRDRLAEAPEDFDGWIRLARAEFQLGNEAAGLAAMDEAIERAPSPEAREALATIRASRAAEARRDRSN